MTNWYDRAKLIQDSDECFMSSADDFQPNEECVELLEHFEGFSEIAYLDTMAKPNVWTIGHGLTRGVKEGDRITYEESVKRKLVEMNRHWNPLTSHIKVPINQDMCNAITAWAYNVGVGAARSSTLLRKLNQKDYDGAADELLRWNRAGGKVWRGLTRRRNAERNMFLSKDWREFYE